MGMETLIIAKLMEIHVHTFFFVCVWGRGVDSRPGRRDLTKIH